MQGPALSGSVSGKGLFYGTWFRGKIKWVSYRILRKRSGSSANGIRRSTLIWKSSCIPVSRMLYYRLAHRMYLHRHYFLARWISQKGVRKTGIEIHPGAKIGKGFFIDHGNGVIIGETTVIGDNVTLYQGVTLGGTGKEQGKRHPTIGNNVMISTGAKVLGSFKIGDNSKIGAGSVVLKEVPPGSTVVGVPGQVVKRNNQSFPQEELDQVNLPDPVREDIMNLQQANTELTNRLLDLERELRELRKEV